MDVEADEEEEEEEEEHPAPADSVVVTPTAADQAPSVEETGPFETDEEDRPEVTLPPRKRLDIALGTIYEVGESSSATVARPAGGLKADYGFVATVDREIVHDPEREVGYGITESWDEIVETLQGAPVSTDTELGGYVREFETRVRQDTDEIYMRLDDEKTERQLLVGRLNMDRRAHAYTCHLMETEARMSREAWVRATDASDLVHGKVMSLRTTVLGQMSEIKELQAADRKRETMISELLRIDHRRSTELSELKTALQGEVTTLQGQVMIDQGVTAALAARDPLRSTNGDDSHNSETGVKRTERATRECTYTDFLKCGTPTSRPLVMKPLTVKGTDLASYTQRFQELALLCGRMFSEESDKIEKYVGGLPDIIHGSVVASEPKTMQEAIEIATELMDKMISIPAPVPMPTWTDSEIVRLLAISSPPASPLSLWSSPPPRIPFPPLPSILSPPSHAASTSSPPLQLPSASHMEDRPEVTLPPRKRLDIALGPRYEVGESSSAAAARPAGGFRAYYGFVAMMDREIMRDPEREVGYGITDFWDERVETLQGAPVSTDTELGGYVREFEMRVRQDMDEIYMRLDDEQTERQLLAGQLNMLFRDRRAHAYTRHLMKAEARMSREAWVRATDASDLVHGEVMSLRTTVLARDALRSTNGDDSHNSRTGVRRIERATRECTYTDFLKCQPLPFKGTKGGASLSQWCERMESFFNISNCAAENQVKFATCTLYYVALTWWNTHVQTVGHEAAYESDKIEKYVGGLPDMIHGSVAASKPKTMQEAIEIATELMDKKIRTFAEHETASKRKSTTNTNNANNQRGTGSGQKLACYECGVQGHFKRECPKLKNNNNHGNQGGKNNALDRVYVVGRAGTDPDANVVTGTFLLNNRYASVLFDTGADRSFVSTTFSTQINIMPSTLDHYYDVELADGRIIGLNTILRGCTLNLLNHPFNIDLMPVELGSFDAIIGMDWLAKYQAVIVCAEKIVRIPWGNKTLIIHGDGRNQGNATRLSIISCTKIEKYVKKGFPIFLAHITTKEVEDKLEKKRLEDVPIVRNFPEVFPDELPGLPPTRPVEF
nr:reverse transcriptase domain-containing protein [Tanacetum cinerariifolium]